MLDDIYSQPTVDTKTIQLNLILVCVRLVRKLDWSRLRWWWWRLKVV